MHLWLLVLTGVAGAVNHTHHDEITRV